jgi:hypothetical protein
MVGPFHWKYDNISQGNSDTYKTKKCDPSLDHFTSINMFYY